MILFDKINFNRYNEYDINREIYVVDLSSNLISLYYGFSNRFRYISESHERRDQ